MKKTTILSTSFRNVEPSNFRAVQIKSAIGISQLLQFICDCFNLFINKQNSLDFLFGGICNPVTIYEDLPAEKENDPQITHPLNL